MEKVRSHLMLCAGTGCVASGTAKVKTALEQELVNGWSLDWRAADWLVPGGAWSYNSKTPIELIQTLAQRNNFV